MNLKKLLVLLGVLFPIVFIQGQEVSSLPFFDRIVNQYSLTRDFYNPYYYNPSNMGAYSNNSFSDLGIFVNQRKSPSYLLNQGNKQTALGIGADSYQVLDNNKATWGSMSYVNQQIRNIQWQTNIDESYIGPYMMADSSKGTSKLEAYEFNGGYQKKIERFSIGFQANYKASLSYREVDPRPKSISSDISLKFGGSYNFYKGFAIDGFLQVELYKQSSDVKFVNQIKQSELYHLGALGTYNHFFGSSYNKVVYNRSMFTTGWGLSEWDKYQFSLGFLFDQGTLDKDVYGSGNGNQALINQLKSDEFKFYVLKRIKLKTSFLDFKVLHNYTRKIGSDFLYTTNQTSLKRLLQDKNYLSEDQQSSIAAIYCKQTKGTFFSIQGRYTYQKLRDVLKADQRFTFFDYHFYDVVVKVSQEFSSSSVFSIEPFVSSRNVGDHSWNIALDSNKQSINNWLLNDLKIKSENTLNFGLSLRYDLKIKPQYGVYVLVDYSCLKYKTLKDNNNYNLRLGITF